MEFEVQKRLYPATNIQVANNFNGLTEQRFPAHQDPAVILARQPYLHCMPHTACRLPHASELGSK